MKKRISQINPVQLGKVLAVLYACISLIIVPFFLLAGLVGLTQHTGVGPGLNMGAGGGIMLLVAAIAFPLFYAAFGFIGGIIAAFVYNLVAGWTGGIEFTIVDVMPDLPAEYQTGRIGT